MLLATLSLLVPLAATPAADLPMPPPPPGMKLIERTDDALPMPPPPAGMHPLSKDDVAALAGFAEDEAPEASEEIDEASADLEALRAVEEYAFDPSAGQNALYLQSAQELGPAHPLRLRLEDVLNDTDLREDAPNEIAQVTDLLAFDVRQVQDRYDIPVEMQPLVADYIRFFQGPGRRWFRKWMSRSTRYIPVMQPILEEAGVPRDTVYLAMIESGFSAQAYSWARAAGPWQFIAGTGREFGLKENFWVDERRDPIKSTRAAARYLKQLYDQLGHWHLAWAGYNTGAARVKRLCERRHTRSFWEISEGRGLAKETRHYVPKLIAAALIAKNPAAFGFRDEEFDFQPPLEFDVVPIPDLTDLSVIARAAGVSEQEIRELNPELKRWCTPPATEDKPYLLRLPKGTADRFAANFEKIPKHERMHYVEHHVKRGDTLSAIARRYGSEVEPIMRFNKLRSARALQINQTLIIPVPQSHARTARREPSATPPSAAPRSRPPLKSEVIAGKTRITYGVQSGDTLWGICQRFNCSVDNLRKWNHLPRRGRRLQPGTVLAIWTDRDVHASGPAHTSAPARADSAAATASVHALAPGETLWSVSRKYGVSVDDLKKWNGISDHRALRVGQRLRVVAQ
ncbi:MAG: LysM peptidoglycan-binding domain-containing protein [Myxococcaceae bacterium]|nr:LysM peptidoglycan-binding domain-containing protein [Myxococcaceae bacterium]